MQSRREFLRNAAALTGSAFVWGSMPEAIARALQIDPNPGTTYRDAEHVVILMQENRSFDHCFGALRGVRGFRDRRVHRKPDGRPVWFQTDAAGRTYAPFRLDMNGSNSTWIGGLPHTWTDQVEARNGGGYDRWLIAKARHDHLPLALGHYTRADIPFYYALADAFTVCDQAFCSSLTGTTPNRLFLWSGAIRKHSGDAARVLNEDADFVHPADWTTFPERLEAAGVTWRVYQNELTIPTGLSADEDAWLSNYGDNPLEYFPQFRVRFAPARRRYVAERVRTLPAEIKARQADGSASEVVARLQRELAEFQREQADYTEAAWQSLPARERTLHERAFTTNADADGYRSLERLSYHDGDVDRSLLVPRGDIFHRFRRDVETGNLPAISWLVAPEEFSDHPSSAWFGAWYVSESLKILTQNPDVWKKTIFILCYDENDGYFDHVSPFIAPQPDKPETGRVSAGLDTTGEIADRKGVQHSMGLGYRCPLVIASPWSRGGCVNSQVFDHTSVIQFIERWLGKNGRTVHEPNISDWRRVVCGDLTSAFRPYQGETYEVPQPLDRDATIVATHKSKFMHPLEVKPLAPDDIAHLDIGSSQERGTRPSCPLPYELEANGRMVDGQLELSLEARNRRFGTAASGAPFNAYSYGETLTARAYAVKAGDKVVDTIPLPEVYRVRIDGPNGFGREFEGSRRSPRIDVLVESGADHLAVRVRNHDVSKVALELRDWSYGAPSQRTSVEPGQSTEWTVPIKASHGWYDFSVRGGDGSFRYFGRVETGEWSISDPAMA